MEHFHAAKGNGIVMYRWFTEGGREVRSTNQVMEILGGVPAEGRM
jgi:hypothetical protein